MEYQIREARKEDIPEMLEIYSRFSKQFVGGVLRDLGGFRRVIRRKGNIRWVALSKQGSIIGYIIARVDKRYNLGRFEEIVINTKDDFRRITRLLVERVIDIFIEKNVAAITATFVENSMYEGIFSTLDFFELEPEDVFMHAILDTQKFLNELDTTFVSRLRKSKGWNGLIQIECENHNIFVRKTARNVETFLWTDESVDFKIVLSRDTLARLIFGIVDPLKCLESSQLILEAKTSKAKGDQLLKALFPETRFLIMDYW